MHHTSQTVAISVDLSQSRSDNQFELIKASEGRLAISFQKPLKENYILVVYEVYDSLLEINQIGQPIIDF